MKSLKIDKSKLIDVTFEEKSGDFGRPASEVKPEYPYGLRICLNNETIKMLGLKEMPEVGAVFSMKAMVEVVSTSEFESKDQGEQYSIDLQITDMDLGIKSKGVEPEKIYELAEAGE